MKKMMFLLIAASIGMSTYASTPDYTTGNKNAREIAKTIQNQLKSTQTGKNFEEKSGVIVKLKITSDGHLQVMEANSNNPELQAKVTKQIEKIHIEESKAVEDEMIIRLFF